MNNIKTRPCVGDIAALALCLVLCLGTAALFFVPDVIARESDAYVIITTPEGETRYPLNTSRTVNITSCGVNLTVKTENGEVWVAASDCPDGVCVNTGRISSPNRAVVCVPARVSVKVEKGEARDADFIIG